MYAIDYRLSLSKPSSLEYLGHAHFWRIVPADLHRVTTPSKLQPMGAVNISASTIRRQRQCHRGPACCFSSMPFALSVVFESKSISKTCPALLQS